MADTAVESVSKPTVQTHCPACGRKGKRVAVVTLRALLKPEFVERLGEPSETRGDCCGSDTPGCRPVAADTGWRFCDSPDCDVVYFSEHGDVRFTKSQLKVKVGIKETAGERPLCYCFGHSVESIKRELQATGKPTALEDIRAKMKDPGCHCETSNPKGACCLGDVARGIEVARRELGLSDDADLPATSTATSTAALASGSESQPHAAATGRGEKIAVAGTLISAVMASSCCWLPLILLAAGVSGAGIAATLEAYRPLFVTLTFGFLAAAFYFAYRKPKCSAASADSCGPQPGHEHERCAAESTAVIESTAVTVENADPVASASTAGSGELAASAECCPPAEGRRLNMANLNRAMLWIVTVLAVAFLLLPSYVGVFLGGDGGPVGEDMNRLVIKLDGLTCEACAATVAEAVRKVPGVVAVEVDFANSQAIVGTESCCPIPKADILAAIKEAGFAVKIVEQQPAGSRSRRSPNN